MTPFIRPDSVRYADRQLARSVFLILLAFFTATMVSQPDVIDAEVEFQTVSSLARNQSFALGGTPEAEAIITIEHQGRQGYNVHKGGPGREDEYFSWYGVGQAYVGFPFYLVGTALHHLLPVYEERHRETTFLGYPRSEYFEHLLVGWRNPVLTALTAWLLVKSVRRLGASRRNAWIAGLSYGLCTFAWTQARSTLSDVQATFFLFLAFHFVLKIQEGFIRLQPPSRSDLFLMGAALGGAFLTRAITAPVIVVIGASAMSVLSGGYRRMDRGFRFLDLGWISLPALACFALFLWTNDVRFGDPFETGYGEVVTWQSYFIYPLHWGLLQLLFAPGRGFLWMAPGVLLIGFWIANLLRGRDPRLPLLLCGVAFTVLIPVAMTTSWHGAWTYGPRYALPLLPFLWLGVAPSLDILEERRFGRVSAAVLLVLGTVIVLPGVLIDHTTHHDLAIQAARLEWPDLPGNEATQEEERFARIQRDFRFAAPWAHWRILRHRVSGLKESFPAESIFFIDHPANLVPAHEREQGFRHFAWVDFRDRLGGPLWPAVLICVAFLVSGLIFATRGLDPNQP